VAHHWCKVASNLDSHPKIRKAGRLGREVFLFALRRNAEPGNPIPGRLPKDELAPWYVADQLQMSEEEAVIGVTSAISAGLLNEEGHCYQIVSWKDGWGKGSGTGADRQARYKENKKLRIGDVSGDSDTVSGVSGDVSGDAGDTDQTRQDKTNKKVPSQGDIALTTVLILKIIKNNPASGLTKLTPAEKTKRLHSWADHVRKMRELDGHSEDEIKAVIDWCQNDSFWRKNILCTETLRAQWEKLTAAMPRSAAKERTKQGALRLVAGDEENPTVLADGSFARGAS
jgi:hypothetical protein